MGRLSRGSTINNAEPAQLRWGRLALMLMGRATGEISPFNTDFHGNQKTIFADTASTWGNCYDVAVAVVVPPGKICGNPAVIRENPC
jgi:hypothetical protein